VHAFNNYIRQVNAGVNLADQKSGFGVAKLACFQSFSSQHFAVFGIL